MPMIAALTVGARPAFLNGLGTANGTWSPWKHRLQTITQFRVVKSKGRTNVVRLPLEKGRIKEAIDFNNWFPDRAPPRKSGHYMDKRELFYYCCCVLMNDGDWNQAGMEGERFIELISLLANNYLGRIAFRGAHHMSNLSEDLVQEAVTKCCLVVSRFSPWNKLDPTKINNAFAYFTTIIRNRMFETLDSPMAQTSIYLEDLMNDDQAVGDLI